MGTNKRLNRLVNRYIEKGIDLVTVSKILGHSDIKMTMRYVHPTPENMRKAVDCLAMDYEITIEDNGHKVDKQGESFDVNAHVSRSYIYN